MRRIKKKRRPGPQTVSQGGGAINMQGYYVCHYVYRDGAVFLANTSLQTFLSQREADAWAATADEATLLHRAGVRRGDGLVSWRVHKEEDGEVCVKDNVYVRSCKGCTDIVIA
jgi:hypothetical protein